MVVLINLILKVHFTKYLIVESLVPLGKSYTPLKWALLLIRLSWYPGGGD